MKKIYSLFKSAMHFIFNGGKALKNRYSKKDFYSEWTSARQEVSST